MTPKQHYKKVMSRGKMAPVDMDKYPKRRGLEGPFRFRNGRIVYYDPKEGQYYDSETDMYLSDKETMKLSESSVSMKDLIEEQVGSSKFSDEKVNYEIVYPDKTHNFTDINQMDRFFDINGFKTYPGVSGRHPNLDGFKVKVVKPRGSDRKNKPVIIRYEPDYKGRGIKVISQKDLYAKAVETIDGQISKVANLLKKDYMYQSDGSARDRIKNLKDDLAEIASDDLLGWLVRNEYRYSRKEFLGAFRYMKKIARPRLDKVAKDFFRLKKKHNPGGEISVQISPSGKREVVPFRESSGDMGDLIERLESLFGASDAVLDEVDGGTWKGLGRW